MEAVRAGPSDTESRPRNRPPEDPVQAETMKCVLWSLLCCASLLMADVLATYHLSAGDAQLIAAQSYAQSRNNGRPPLRTLNPASKCH